MKKTIMKNEKIKSINSNKQNSKSMRLKNKKVGDRISFGRYMQNDAESKENIMWHILDKKDDKILIISDKALDCKKFNEEKEDVTWETCSLRKWLNNDFYDIAFNESEKQMIETTHVTAHKNPEFDIDSGNWTNDKIFLLSVNEVKTYLVNDRKRRCLPTAYAVKNGAFKGDGFWSRGHRTLAAYYWLRTSGGYTNQYAATVHSDSSIYCLGNRVNIDDCCVRPALWLNLN